MDIDIAQLLALLGLILGIPLGVYFALFQRKLHQFRVLVDDVSHFVDDYDDAIADGKLTDAEIGTLIVDAAKVYADAEVLVRHFGK